MKKLILTVITVAFVSIVGGQAGAAPPTLVSIDLLRQLDNTPAGWRSSGAFTDLGTWDGPPKHFGGVPSPTTGTLQEWTTQYGSEGTFRIRWESQFNFAAEVDRCEILGGTGAYAGLHGTGTWTFDVYGGYKHITCNATVLSDDRP
jgi:hypothetical protein